MSRKPKYGSAPAKKIGVLLPLPTISKLDKLVRSKGSDRSLVIAELLDNAEIITQTTIRSPPTELTGSARRMEEDRIRRLRQLNPGRVL